MILMATCHSHRKGIEVKMQKENRALKRARRRRRRAADLRFGDFVPSEFHHCKISLAQGADDLIEADLQGPSLARPGLSCLAAL